MNEDDFIGMWYWFEELEEDEKKEIPKRKTERFSKNKNSKIRIKP